MSPPSVTANKRSDLAKKLHTTARFALEAPVLPLVTDTLPLAEALRSALLGGVKRIVLREQPDLPIAQVWQRCPAFYGKDSAGQPLQGDAHAYFLPTDEDGDGRID